MAQGKAKIYQFLRVCVHQHFDLSFLGVQILWSSSIGGGGGIFFGMAQPINNIIYI
jgi:hypothetical protein